MWLYIPRTFWPSEPADAELNLESNWCSQKLASSATWRSKHSLPRTWRQRLKKVSWMRRLSGLMWPTPNAADSERTMEVHKGGNPTLARAAKSFPPVQDWVGMALSLRYESFSDAILLELGSVIKQNLQLRSDGLKSSEMILQLNPRMAEWLVGLPGKWTALDSAVMESYQSWRQLHSSYLADVLRGTR